MIEKIQAYFRWEKETLQETHNAVACNNRTTLIMLLCALVASNLALLIFGLAQSGYSSYQLFTGFMAFYMFICLVLVVKMPSLPAVYLTYGVQIVSVLLCLHASAFVDPDYINAEAYVFFLLFPVLCIDASPRIDGVQLALFAAYLHNISAYKTGRAQALESTTIIGFTLLGLLVGHCVRYRILKALLRIERGEQAAMREGLLGLRNCRGLIRDLEALPTPPQAVVCIRIDELHSPVLSFGIQYDAQPLRALGEALMATADAQGIVLYACGSEILGLMQPRVLEGVFQRLEPLYSLLSEFAYPKEDGGQVALHFGIGAALCEQEGIEAALHQAADACAAAQKDGKNRIVI